MALFYFAWVNADETTFVAGHEREDEQVFGFEITHTEGEWAVLRIDIVNPREGLLKAGRKRWAWLAYDAGATTHALFFGRLVGVPQDMQDEVVRLEFIARPRDYDNQKQAVANTLKQAPYWDPVWIAEERREDPDATLDARPMLWHINRTTHVVSVSDILNGEDGTVLVNADFFRDSLHITYSEPPIRRVKCEADVYWTQFAHGSVDMTEALLDAADDAGSRDGSDIKTYTGEGLARDWPEKGDSIGGGWRVGTSHVIRGEGVWVAQEFAEVTTVSFSQIARVDFPLWTFRPHLEVDYEVTRSRQEHVEFTLEADVQSLLKESGDDVLRVTLASRDIDEEIDEEDTGGGFEMPIGDVRRRAYFTTDRGKVSLEYLIALCRAKLLARARAVQVRFEIEFEDGINLSCRKNAFIQDERIPGGSCAGKIVGYTLSANGDTGILGCSVVIGCTIGTGETLTITTGTPNYANAGYVNDGYQTVTGVTMPIPSEVTYTNFDDIPPDDDDLDFMALTAESILFSDSEYDGLEMINGREDQEDILNTFLGGFYPDPESAIAALQLAYTEFRMRLKPLTSGPFRTDYNITVSELMVPQTINLEGS